jgi:predicted nucleic acid-binding protein
MESPCGRAAPPAAVLDTNVVLDWLVFGDASVQALAAAVEGGVLRWLACPRMRDELARTLRYPAMEKWSVDGERVLAFFDRSSLSCPNPTPLATAPACSDADDQVFVDLALAERAAWLLTRDRALLRLARPMLARGVRVATPARWSAAEEEGAAAAAPR